METGPLQSYLDKWLSAQPYQRQALAFVDPARDPGHLALAALEHELLLASQHIQEPSVAAAKLQWWGQELQAASKHGGQHPLSQVLFDQPQAQSIPVELWTAPIWAALEELEQATAADFGQQWVATLALQQHWAKLETAWWYGPAASADRASGLAAVHRLLISLTTLGQAQQGDALPLPMQRMAKHRLDRKALTVPSPALSLAIREQVQDINQSWQHAITQAGPLTVFRAVQARVDRTWIRSVLAGKPLQLAANNAARPRIATLWQAWRAARTWQQAIR